MKQITDTLALTPSERSDPTGSCTVDVEFLREVIGPNFLAAFGTASIEDVDVSEDGETATVTMGAQEGASGGAQEAGLLPPTSGTWQVEEQDGEWKISGVEPLVGYVDFGQ